MLYRILERVEYVKEQCRFVTHAALLKARFGERAFMASSSPRGVKSARATAFDGFCLSLYAPGSAMPSSRPDPPGFIRANMRIAPVPTLPEIRIYTAHPASGLWRLAELDEDGSGPLPPYWAYHWAGGV